VAYTLKAPKSAGQGVTLVTIAGLLLGLAVLARTAALAVLPAAACSLFLLRRAKWAVLLTAVVLVRIAPWVAWARSHPAPSESILA
jgi:4-amino-4-deoxy-L-arabinose transferase-like glycosyltransferase